MPDPESTARDLDFSGSRRLTGLEEWFWYVFAGVSYITVSMFHKSLLNWFVGPLWLVAVVVVGPALWDRVCRRGRAASDAAERR